MSKIEELEFLIDALSSGRDETAAARARCCEQLETAKSLAVLTPRGEPRVLEPEETRLRFPDRDAMLANINAAWSDCDWTLWMEDDYSIVVDVKAEVSLG